MKYKHKDMHETEWRYHKTPLPLPTYPHSLFVNHLAAQPTRYRKEDDADQAQDPPVPPVMIALGMPAERKIDRLQDEDYHVQGHVGIGRLLGLLVTWGVFGKGGKRVCASDSRRHMRLREASPKHNKTIPNHFDATTYIYSNKVRT